MPHQFAERLRGLSGHLQWPEQPPSQPPGKPAVRHPVERPVGYRARAHIDRCRTLMEFRFWCSSVQMSSAVFPRQRLVSLLLVAAVSGDVQVHCKRNRNPCILAALRPPTASYTLTARSRLTPFAGLRVSIDTYSAHLNPAWAWRQYIFTHEAFWDPAGQSNAR